MCDFQQQAWACFWSAAREREEEAEIDQMDTFNNRPRIDLPGWVLLSICSAASQRQQVATSHRQPSHVCSCKPAMADYQLNFNSDNCVSPSARLPASLPA